MAVYAVDAGLSFDPVPVISQSLNGGATAAGADLASRAPRARPRGGPAPPPEFSVSGVSGLDAARAGLRDGASGGLILITREAANGDTSFELVSDTSPDSRGRRSSCARQHRPSRSQDRDERQGMTADQQAALFAPVDYTVTPASDPSKHAGGHRRAW